MLGIGAGALATNSIAPLLAAPSDGRRGYVITVTHGVNDPTRVMLALFTATRLPAGDNHVWFAIDGGQLCKKGEADKVTSPLFVKQGNAAHLLAQIRDKGTAIHI
jgi:predicted peroxiredoxin